MTTTRVGVLGDSHCQSAAELDDSVTEALAGCDYIVHLGDVSTSDVLDRLENIAPVIGVTSQTDVADARLQGTAREFEVSTRRIAVRRSLAEGETFDDRVEVVLHGGTHDHAVQMRGTTLFVNPGSTRWAGRNPTLAILEVSEASIGVEMVAVSDG